MDDNELIERIRDLAEIEPPARWEERALARWRADQRRQRLRIAALAIAAAVTLALGAALIALR